MKVRIGKKTATFLLLLGLLCVVVTGCGKDDGKDGLVSLGKEEAREEGAGILSDEPYGQGADTKKDTAGGESSVRENGEVTAGTATPKEGTADGGDSAAETDAAKSEVYVYVCGEVNCPGVYKLSPDARIYEAIDAAGGLCADAASEYVNQAQKVEDGLQIYVPSKEEAESGLASALGASSGEVPTEGASAKVNLNSATVEELKTLPGIGDAKAQSIVSYRETNGMFRSIEDLMQVEGIKSGVYDKIKDKVTV